MQALLVLVCSVLLVVVGSLGSAQTVTVKQAALEGHDTFRRQEARDEHASNIYQLKWDHDLRRKSADWAARCEFSHPTSLAEGQNLYYESPVKHHNDYYVREALKSWMAEKNYNTDGSFNCCNNGNYNCCHYTQMVSAQSRNVGCAVHHCAQLTMSGSVITHNAAFVVCDYSPKGNIAENGHLEAYTTGNTCSGCDAGDTCNDGLCVATRH